tara:strand:+ start:7765 stop:8403 length:639 start_codon:yes stop_codon:yes gene_type:complete
MKKIKNITKAIKINKIEMLSFLKVSNLILFATTLMLCLTVILFKEGNWGNVNQASILLWVSTMLLIVSASYYYYFEFQFSGDNWLNFGGEEEEEEIEEFMEIGNPNIPTPDSSPNEDANNPQITRMNEQLDELIGPKDIHHLHITNNDTPQLDIALHINKSNLEHIEFLENKVKELQKNLIDEYKYINNLTNITDKYCIREYTEKAIEELKQ